MISDENQITVKERGLVSSFAVRGIGPAGMDLVCVTVLSVDPVGALDLTIRKNPKNSLQVRAWVVTKL